MHKLTYTRLAFDNDTDIPYLKNVYQSNYVSKYLSIADNYFNYVTNTNNVYFYKVYDSNTLIGTIHIEQQGQTLYFSLLVFTEFQRAGYGTEIVKNIKEDVFDLGYKSIEVSINESNTASLKLFEKSGFTRTSAEGGLIDFVFRINE